MKDRVRIAYLVSHPIQYQVPLLRRIAQEPDIDLTVLFGSDFSVRGYSDPGFKTTVKWDVPLLEGYRHEFLPSLRDIGFSTVTSPISRGMLQRLRGRSGEPPFDLLWVHGYHAINVIQGMVWAKSLGIPVAVRAESWLQGRQRNSSTLLAKKIYFGVLRWMVDGVLCIGTLNRQYWQHYMGGRVPLFDMPYAVDNEFFRRKSTEAAARRTELLAELGMEPGRPIILYAAKLQKRKRCGDLIEAYRQLLANWNGLVVPGLVIVGDGEMRIELEQAATGLEGVRFCGFRNQSEMPRFFDLATVFVLPSRHEPWGLVVNEVMNAGRAVIVSDEVGCHPDLITNGVEGFVYPAGDVGALTGALRVMLETPGLAARMGQRACQRVSGWSFEEDVAGLRRAVATLTKRIEVEVG